MPDEPETYDLAFDPEDDQPEPQPETAKPAKPIRKPDVPATGEPDTFELEDVEPEFNDPRAAGTASRPAAKPPIDPAPDVDDDQPDEPVAVSPARAQANREEQRIRAAQELAEADARKKKMILTIVASVVVVGILAFVVLQLVS